MNVFVGAKGYYSKNIDVWRMLDGQERWECAICYRLYHEYFVISDHMFSIDKIDFSPDLPLFSQTDRNNNSNTIGSYGGRYGFLIIDRLYQFVASKHIDFCFNDDFSKDSHLFNLFISEIMDTNLHEFFHFIFGRSELIDMPLKPEDDKEIYELIMQQEEGVVLWLTYFIGQLLFEADIQDLRLEMALINAHENGL